MAIVKNPAIGNYSGRIGNHVYRVIKGKTYVSIRPIKYNASKSAAAKGARKNFSSTVKLAGSVNVVPILKKIWHASEIEGYSPYHKIIKSNSSLVKNGNLTTKNIISPDGIFLELSSLSVQNKILDAEFSLIEKNSITFPAEVVFLFYFQEYNKAFFSFVEKINDAQPDGKYFMSISLNPRIMTGLKEDPHPLIFMTLIGSTPSRKKIYWTTTVARQL